MIDSCISALHLYGPSRTTVANVVAIAKMSPGIVRFYFDSKAAMLVASLRFLAAEFEERVMVPVAQLKHQPVVALKMLVDLYLDADIASPRKVSVWYAFWGEASSRREYSDICGATDQGFAALLRELIAALIIESGQSHLDVDGVTLGLVGAFEILWQDIAFQLERDLDRVDAKRRCVAFLEALFPAQFAAPASAGRRSNPRSGSALTRFAGSAYFSARVFAAERELLLRRSWTVMGLESQLAVAGDFLAADIGGERALVVRDAAGSVKALRNSCPDSPHTLVAPRAGRLEETIECRPHGQKFGFDGSGLGTARVSLPVLDLYKAAGLLFVRSPDRLPQPSRDAALELAAPDSVMAPVQALVLLKPPLEMTVAADWKVVAEQWLESVPVAVPNAAGDALSWTPPSRESRWSARRYRRVVDCVAEPHWRNDFLAPHQLLETRPDGLSILQVFGTAPGRCLVRRLDYTVMSPDHTARAAAYLGQRLAPFTRGTRLALAESVQRGMQDFGYARDGAGPASPAVAWLRKFLAVKVTILGEI